MPEHQSGDPAEAGTPQSPDALTPSACGTEAWSKPAGVGRDPVQARKGNRADESSPVREWKLPSPEELSSQLDNYRVESVIGRGEWVPSTVRGS